MLEIYWDGPARQRTKIEANFSYCKTPVGSTLVAKTDNNICAIIICATKPEGLTKLQGIMPNATLAETKQTDQERNAIQNIILGKKDEGKLSLYIAGTEFQLKVWGALMKIPYGNTSSYKEIAKAINCPRSTRAVGTTIGRNPIPLLVPCHRVVQSNGQMGNYRWGASAKARILAFEKRQAEEGQNPERAQ